MEIAKTTDIVYIWKLFYRKALWFKVLEFISCIVANDFTNKMVEILVK